MSWIAPEPVYEGSLDDVQDYFESRLWSDGLPIVPPTRERVERFLERVERRPDDVLGVNPPAYRQATIWSVAVNGVMAGCRPEYMPVLVAVVEAISDPDFHIEDAGSTPGWEPIIVVSGPVVDDLGFNAGAGVLAVGRRANTSIGRFLRLFMRNVIGYLPPPGSTSKGSIGSTFHVALPESSGVLGDVGWPTWAMERGFGPDENVVTVQSVVAVSPPIYTSGPTVRDHLEGIGVFFGATCAPYLYLAQTGHMHTILVMSPIIARTLAGNGMTKDDVRDHLQENATVPIGHVDLYRKGLGSGQRSLAEGPDDFVEQNCRNFRMTREELLDLDPARPVPAFPLKDQFAIVVAGDPFRNQSRGYIGNVYQGAPVSRVIRSEKA